MEGPVLYTTDGHSVKLVKGPISRKYCGYSAAVDNISLYGSPAPSENSQMKLSTFFMGLQVLGAIASVAALILALL